MTLKSWHDMTITSSLSSLFLSKKFLSRFLKKKKNTLPFQTLLHCVVIFLKYCFLFDMGVYRSFNTIQFDTSQLCWTHNLPCLPVQKIIQGMMQFFVKIIDAEFCSIWNIFRIAIKWLFTQTEVLCWQWNVGKKISGLTKADLQQLCSFIC